MNFEPSTIISCHVNDKKSVLSSESQQSRLSATSFSLNRELQKMKTHFLDVLSSNCSPSICLPEDAVAQDATAFCPASVSISQQLWSFPNVYKPLIALQVKCSLQTITL